MSYRLVFRSNLEEQTIPSPRPLTPPPPPTTTTTEAATNTDEPHISLDDLQPILTSSIARHLNLNQREQRPSGDEEDVVVKPSEDIVEDPTPSTLGYNVIPRVSKLRELDNLIKRKNEILERLDVRIETNRKILKIQASRIPSTPEVVRESESVEKKSKPKETEISTSESSSTESSSTDFESAEDSESTTSSSSEQSSSSASSTTTVKAAPARQPPIPAEEPKSDGESTIEDPFSARQEAQQAQQEDPPTSPTTVYLDNLRKKILDQYQQKYN
ncbi:hypothetical protein GCK72_011634 [Caenorhabditis remanei]|uniref:Uncharacterized protein n=1 Tax=Caenorhabditis remanei TaxID=31234 RepID=A0A6A5H6J8_CAERE|nr:hypothetical protein GCK72_011634 [Caenorhabditis remanei]KAF1763368.1 hypothetical protein GCK72_011634 [Caenorhabditis remanei]